MNSPFYDIQDYHEPIIKKTKSKFRAWGGINPTQLFGGFDDYEDLVDVEWIITDGKITGVRLCD